MIIKTPIKQFGGAVVGYVEEDSVTKFKTGYDFYMRKVGTYDPRLNVTRDFGNKIIAQGDALASLIFQAEAEYQAKRKAGLK